MSVRPELFQYFDHLGRTITLRELAEDTNQRNVIALRHDIDHDLDLALEVAHHEHKRGMRATYFLLHTHKYWRDPDFLLKCKQLEAYGHEVGLHLNLLTEWFAGRIDNINDALRDILAPLREAGIKITGTSAHGDRACYENGFSNYWIWRELHGDDPATEQLGRSAEGVRVIDPAWQIPYPANHRLKRNDGAELDLWQSSLAAHNLQYDAMHIPLDHYWSDSGGKWQRTGDPLQNDISHGRHVVLIHPVWWRGEKKQYFFLSTARSGSLWLSNVIDRATNCKGVHEFTFNHRFENDEPVLDKRTTDDFQSLCDDRPAALQLLRQSLRWMRQQPGDVAEANVYLEPFLTELRELAPNAVFIHLHRDGRDVVRSILNRGWYDNPDDHKHRALPIENWNRLTRFERACWYWRYTNEMIAPFATNRLRFEKMVSDVDYLSDQLARYGIILHPLLAERVFHERVNASKVADVPAHEQWSSEYQKTFTQICGAVQQMLGYAGGGRTNDSDEYNTRERSVTRTDQSQTIVDLDYARVPRPTISASHMRVVPNSDGVLLRPAPTTADATNIVALLTTGKWNRVEPQHGVPCREDVYYHCSIESTAGAKVRARLFVLFYDSAGALIRPFQAGTIRAGESQRMFSFAPAVGANHLALALHFGKPSSGAQPAGEDETLLLKRVQLESIPMDRRYSATPAADAVGASAAAK